MSLLSCHATFWASGRTTRHVSFCTRCNTAGRVPCERPACRGCAASGWSMPLSCSWWPKFAIMQACSYCLAHPISSLLSGLQTRLLKWQPVRTWWGVLQLALNNSVRETRILFLSRPNFQYWDRWVVSELRVSGVSRIVEYLDLGFQVFQSHTGWMST